MEQTRSQLIHEMASGDVRVMLPSETDSQSAGFNLLPHATVRGVRIELTHTGAQNRRPTLDHPPGEHPRFRAEPCTSSACCFH